MKKFFLIIFFTLSLQGFCQEKHIIEKPKVDKRVELLSIVFRLAEAPEYSSTSFKLYTDKIEKHFGAYKNHELIQFSKSIIKSDRISHDAVMSIAVHLDENLNLLTAVMDYSLQSRWTKKHAAKFVALLKKFYKDADCEKFFNDNADLYAEASKRFLPVYENMDLQWYRTFFGNELKNKFIIINGLGNGPGSYGSRIYYQNGDKDIYAIIGVSRTDDKEMPIFPVERNFLTLLHEFNHSFVNHLIYKNSDLFRKSGKQIFALLESEMSSLAYDNWGTMIIEALVRAAEIKYMKDHNNSEQEINLEIQRQMGLGFLWIKELVDALDNYDMQRNFYQTLESYMPNIAEAYKKYAETVREIDNKRPRVISVDEFTTGGTNVDAAIKTITINFNMPLSDKGYSFDLGAKGRDAFPKVEKVEFINGNKSVIMHVALEKEKEYQFIVIGKSFLSVDGVAIKDYEINFKTKK